MFAVVETIWAIILIGVLSEIFHLIESFMSTFPIFKDFISILLWSLIVFLLFVVLLLTFLVLYFYTQYSFFVKII